MMKRSPFFYVGDKYKLMPQLNLLFPVSIETYYEPFLGGGSSMINTSAKKYVVNDVDKYVIQLHKFLVTYSKNRDYFFKCLFNLISQYDLSCSYKGDLIPSEIKKKYPKTYFAKINSQPYKQLKDDYNNTHKPILLYLLLIYGFNHMIRFNSSGVFNLPVGNVDFNKNVYNALNSYFDFASQSNVSYSCLDYQKFIKKQTFGKSDFIYFDPPYLISLSEYNSLWNDENEKQLYLLLDELSEKGVLWGITNLIRHKGKTNKIFEEWAKKYTVYNIKSNYISFNDNSIKEGSKEVYVTNYGKSNI